MFSNLTVFQTAHAMSVHAGARQALIAQNVANADTPGYRARDLPAFDQIFEPRRHDPGTMRGSRRHVYATKSTGVASHVARRLLPCYSCAACRAFRFADCERDLGDFIPFDLAVQ